MAPYTSKNRPFAFYFCLWVAHPLFIGVELREEAKPHKKRQKALSPFTDRTFWLFILLLEYSKTHVV